MKYITMSLGEWALISLMKHGYPDQIHKLAHLLTTIDLDIPMSEYYWYLYGSFTDCWWDYDVLRYTPEIIEKT